MPETIILKPKRLSKKKTRRLFKFISTLVIAGLIFGLGVNVGTGRITFGSQSGVQKNLPNRLDYSSVDELYKALKANFDGNLDTNKLLDGVKKGLVDATGDQHTNFLNASDYKDFNSQLTGSFSGIGAELSEDGKGSIVVVAPIAGSPAEKAGLKAKDVIVQVDGKTLTDISVNDVISKIRGPKNTTVTLKIARDGKLLDDIKIIRQDITSPSVVAKVDNGVGYLTITRFGDDTTSLSRKAAEDFKAKNVKAVVLDMRNNPGGLLDAAVSVSSLWLPEGKTVLTERRDNIVTSTYKAEGNPALTGIPTVVLIDGGSASASEITAGALKDNGVANLVGEKSYGKGSVQQLVKLSGGAFLKVTIARWYTPNGKNIDKAGIQPDTPVKISDDDVKNGTDPQKAAALKSLGL